MKPKTIKIQNLDIEYVVRGKGEDVLFLHGGSVSFRTWIPFLNELAQCAHVWAVSLPGAGMSSKFPANWTFNDYGHLLRDFVKSMKIKPHLCGHSFGGAIAISTMSKFENNFKELILLAPGGIPSKTKSALGSALTVAWQQFKTFFWGDKHAKTDIRLNVRHHFKDMLKISSMFGDLNLVGELDNIQKRTTILWGIEDTVLPIDSLSVFEKRLEHCNSYMLKAGHGFLNSHKSEVISILCKEFAEQ